MPKDIAGQDPSLKVLPLLRKLGWNTSTTQKMMVTSRRDCCHHGTPTIFGHRIRHVLLPEAQVVKRRPNPQE